MDIYWTFKKCGPYALRKQGDVLFFNDEALDLSVLVNGADLPPSAHDCPYIAGVVERDENGNIKVTLAVDVPPFSLVEKDPPPLLNAPDAVIALPKFGG